MEVESFVNKNIQQQQQQHQTLIKILQNTNDTFHYGEIIHLFDLINSRNPYYQILDYQFYETQLNDKQVLAIKIMDSISGLTKTLKIYQKNTLNEDVSEFKQLMKLYKGSKQLLRNDLILKIYDIYFLESFKIVFYFVIEMEYVDSAYNLQQFNLCENTNNDVKSIMQSAINYIDETMFISKKRQFDLQDYQFYITSNGDDQKKIKLNILQDEVFYYQNSTNVFSSKQKQQSDNFNEYLTMVGEEKQLLQQQYELSIIDQQNQHNNQSCYDLDNQKESDHDNDSDYGANFEEKDFQRYLQISKFAQSEYEEQVKEILDNNQIPKGSLVSYIEKKAQSLLKKHPIELFEILSQHPQYNSFSLIESGENYIILKTKIYNKSYYLKLQKFNNINEADKIYKMYERYYSFENKDLFSPLNNFEILCGENYAYILIEEEYNLHSKEETKQDYIFKEILFKETESISGFYIENPNSYIQIILHLMKSIIRIYQQKLFQVCFLAKNAVFYSLISNQKRISLSNPLFLKKLDDREESFQIQDFINSIEFLFKLFKKLNSKKLGENTHQQYNQIITKFNDLILLLKRSNFNIDQLKNQLKQIDYCLRTTEQYQNILSKYHINQKYPCIIITDCWKIQIKPQQGQLVKTIKSLNEIQLDTLEICEIDELYKLPEINLPQMNHIKTLILNLILTDQDTMNGVYALINLLPSVKEAKLFLQIKCDNSFNYKALSSFNNLNVLDIQVHFDQNYKKSEENSYKSLLDLFQNINKLNSLRFETNYYEIQNLDKEWDSKFGESELLKQYQKSYQSNNQWNNQLITLQQFNMQKLGFKYSKLVSNLKIFFKQLIQQYQQFDIFLSNLINEYEIECSTMPFTQGSNVLILIFSNKQNQFEDLLITIDYNNGEPKIISYNNYIECNVLNRNQHIINLTFQIVKAWWIFENRVKWQRQFLKKEFHQSCICCQNIQKQVQLYENQQELQSLDLFILLCSHVFSEMQINKNFYQFSNLTKLSRLTLHISTHFLTSNLFNKQFYPHLKQLKSLNVLYFYFEYDEPEIFEMKKNLKKLSNLVLFYLFFKYDIH